MSAHTKAMREKAEAMKEKMRLFELKFKRNEKTGKMETEANEVEKMPAVFVPSKKLREETAREMGFELGPKGELRFSEEKRRLIRELEKRGVSYEGEKEITKEDYEKYKEALREKMGLKGKLVTQTEAEDVAILKKNYPEGYKEYQKGKYKTPQEALKITILKYYPKQYKEYLEGKYKTSQEALNIANLKEYYPEEYKKYQQGKYKTPQEALKAIDIASLKGLYPEQYKEYQRLVDEEGWKPEQALKEIMEFQEEQNAKREAAKRKKAAEK